MFCKLRVKNLYANCPQQPGRSKLLPVKPVLDEEGVLRCDGRLKFADGLPWETRYPIILPRNHQITKLIIKDSYDENQHGGHKLSPCSPFKQILDTLSWRIKSGRKNVSCADGERSKHVMAPLPALRTQKSLRTFSQTSIDFAGPFYNQQGRGKTHHKR